MAPHQYLFVNAETKTATKKPDRRVVNRQAQRFILARSRIKLPSTTAPTGWRTHQGNVQAGTDDTEDVQTDKEARKPAQMNVMWPTHSIGFLQTQGYEGSPGCLLSWITLPDSGRRVPQSLALSRFMRAASSMRPSPAASKAAWQKRSTCTLSQQQLWLTCTMSVNAQTHQGASGVHLSPLCSLMLCALFVGISKISCRETLSMRRS